MGGVAFQSDNAEKIHTYSPFQKNIYTVSVHLRSFHILRSPRILAGRRNKGEMQTENL